jgi:hypothetical protein
MAASYVSTCDPSRSAFAVSLEHWFQIENRRSIDRFQVAYSQSGALNVENLHAVQSADPSTIHPAFGLHRNHRGIPPKPPKPPRDSTETTETNDEVHREYRRAVSVS